MNEIEAFIKRLSFSLSLKKDMVIFLFYSIYALVDQFFKLLKFKKQTKLDRYEIPYDDLTGFQCVITGGSGEIGLVCVKRLLKKNCNVLIATIPNAGQTFDELKVQLEDDLKEFKKDQWELCYLDLSCFQSINEFVERFKQSNRTIDILINNAGKLSFFIFFFLIFHFYCLAVFLIPFVVTKNGFEKHLAVNYLGHCLLTLNLLPVLKPSERSIQTRKRLNLSLRSKVINISSYVHRSVDADLNFLNKANTENRESYSSYRAYSQSKLLIIAFGFYLSNYILPKSNLNIDLANLHPGGIASNMIFKSHLNFNQNFITLFLKVI